MSTATEKVLLQLAGKTAEAVEETLNIFAPGAVSRGIAAAVPEGGNPLEGISAPAVACDVSYVDGVTGGNVVFMPLLGARRLAAAMMGTDPDDVADGGETLDEMELSAVGEAMNQMMSAAAVATSKVIDEEVEIAPPVTRIILEQAELAEAVGSAPHLATVSLGVLGVPCRLVQLVPNAFVVRMTRALESYTERTEHASVGDSLLSVDVRVWAELGRARMPTGRLVGLPGGAIVELDKETDELVDLYVDGMRYATGRLVVCDDETWGLRVEEVLASPQPILTGRT